jgi:hypothetical protein
MRERENRGTKHRGDPQEALPGWTQWGWDSSAASYYATHHLGLDGAPLEAGSILRYNKTRSSNKTHGKTQEAL